MQTSRRPDPTATTATRVTNAGWCRPPKTQWGDRDAIMGRRAAPSRPKVVTGPSGHAERSTQRALLAEERRSNWAFVSGSRGARCSRSIGGAKRVIRAADRVGWERWNVDRRPGAYHRLLL